MTADVDVMDEVTRKGVETDDRFTTETQRTQRNSNLSFAERYRQWTNLRRRRTSNLPSRSISRDWAKTLFSVPPVPLWCKNVCCRIYEKQYLVLRFVNAAAHSFS